MCTKINLPDKRQQPGGCKTKADRYLTPFARIDLMFHAFRDKAVPPLHGTMKSNSNKSREKMGTKQDTQPTLNSLWLCMSPCKHYGVFAACTGCFPP